MINLIAPTITDAPYMASAHVSRISEFDTLFPSRERFSGLNTTSRFEKLHGEFACMSTLTEDGRCTCCLMEFEP